VLGCTELPLILSPENMPVATLDIADIHIRTIVARILAD
jgi:aspartate racemase